jgi:hypothetical protein
LTLLLRFRFATNLRFLFLLGLWVGFFGRHEFFSPLQSNAGGFLEKAAPE